MIKTILIIGILLVSVLIGCTIKNYFKIRNLIYLDFKDVIQSIKSEISFLKTEKLTLLSGQNCKSKYSQEFLDKYVQTGKGNSIYLRQHENDELNKMFDNIGKNNVEGELNNLEYYELKIAKSCNDTEDKLNKYGTFSIKMSIILGTLIAIILI